MKKMFVLMFVVCCVSVFAFQSNVVEDSDGKWVRYDVVRDKEAKQLGTALAIDEYVESKIDYQYAWYARDESMVWKLSQGDCTDKAILKCNMLHSIGIKCRIVHGYAYWSPEEVNSTDIKYTHDWYEFLNDDKWETYEGNKFYNLSKVGMGIW